MSGVAGLLTDVDVTLWDIDQTYPDDMDVVLFGPAGEALTLMSDVCGTDDLIGTDLTLDDEAATVLPNSGPCASGSYRPTDVDQFGDSTDVFDSYVSGTSLSALDGANPNGAWALYVSDDTANDTTYVRGGWTLRFTTAVPANITIPGTASGVGPATPYPRGVKVSGASGTISDVDVKLKGLHHTRGQDIDLLLVGPHGQSVVLMGHVCGIDPIDGADLTFDDEAPNRLDDFQPCDSGSWKPSDEAGTHDFPDPAPPGPYGSSLSVFDGTDPDGVWRFFFYDDSADKGGLLEQAPELVITRSTAPTCLGTPVTVDLSAGDKPTGGNDVVLGTSGDDVVNGLGGNDTICGGGGNDTIQGGAGDDFLDGGTGSDTVTFLSSGHGVTANLTTTAAQNTGPATGTDFILDFEDLTGSRYADTLVGDGNGNYLRGLAGDDSIIGAAGQDTILGSTGRDVCDGGNDADVAHGCEVLANVP